MSKNKREIRKKVNIMDIGINFVMFYFGRFIPARYSFIVNISVRADIRRCAFLVANLLKLILKISMVEVHAPYIYPEIGKSNWDKHLSCGCVSLQNMKSAQLNQSIRFSKVVTSVSTD